MRDKEMKGRHRLPPKERQVKICMLLKHKKKSSSKKISSLASLTPQQVRWVRKKLEEGISQLELANKLGVSQPTISNIIHGKTYKRVA